MHFWSLSGSSSVARALLNAGLPPASLPTALALPRAPPQPQPLVAAPAAAAADASAASPSPCERRFCPALKISVLLPDQRKKSRSLCEMNDLPRAGKPTMTRMSFAESGVSEERAARRESMAAGTAACEPSSLS